VTSNSLYLSIRLTGTGAHIEVIGLPLVRLPCRLKSNCDSVVLQDCGFCGVNFMDYGGSKLWIVISPSSAKKLKDIMKKVAKVDCPHVLDSKECLLHPALLHAWRIKFKLVVTTPGTIHIVLNMFRFLLFVFIIIPVFAITDTSINYFDAKHDLPALEEISDHPCECETTGRLTAAALANFYTEKNN